MGLAFGGALYIGQTLGIQSSVRKRIVKQPVLPSSLFKITKNCHFSSFSFLLLCLFKVVGGKSPFYNVWNGHEISEWADRICGSNTNDSSQKEMWTLSAFEIPHLNSVLGKKKNKGGGGKFNILAALLWVYFSKHLKKLKFWNSDCVWARFHGNKSNSS